MITLNSLILEFKKDWRKVPNIITLTRLLLGFLPAIFILVGWYDQALIAFVILASTDWVDGYVARRTNQTTKIGRVIDPIADRVFMGVTIISLISKVATWMAVALGWFVLSAFVICIIIARAYKNGIHAKPNIAGKIKTVFLSILVGCLILYQVDGFVYVYDIIPSLLVFTLLFSTISFFGYILDYLFINKIQD